MVRMRSSTLRSTLIGMILTLLLIAAAAIPAAAAWVAKTYSAVVSPATAVAGSSTTFSIAFTNKSNITLGSINVQVPPKFAIAGMSVPQGTVSRTGNNIQWRSVGLAAGGSTTMSVSVVVQCVAAGPQWFFMARSGSDYTGTTFSLDAKTSKRTTKVTGACHLVFTDDGQPTSAHPGETISSAAFDTGAGPVKVAVLDGSNNLSSYPATIAMAIGTNPPGNGTLGGTPSQPASGGVSSFNDLSIDLPGLGYTLVASAPDILSATSNPFNIAGLEVHCANVEADCVGTLSDATTTATVNVKADGASTTDLIMTLVNDGLDCSGYEESSTTVDFNVTSATRYKVITMTVDTGQEAVEGFVPADFYEVCYQSPNPFTEKTDSSTVTTGLLPNCDGEVPISTAPCVLSREQDSTLAVITFLAPGGDPKGRV